MTLPDALAWAEARTTDRWRMVAAQNPSNHGDLYAQMDAEAMDTLAEAVREREARWEGLKSNMIDLYNHPSGESSCSDLKWLLNKMRALERGTEAKHD